ARGIAFQPVAHQAVKSVEPLAHVGRTQGHVNPGGRPKPEHCLGPVQDSQQSLQSPRIESSPHLDPTPTTRLDHKWPVLIDIAARFRCPRWNHFNSNHRRGYRSPSTMYPATIFIQRADSQTSLSAELLSHQSTRFELRHQSRSLSTAPA